MTKLTIWNRKLQRKLYLAMMAFLIFLVIIYAYYWYAGYLFDSNLYALSDSKVNNNGRNMELGLQRSQRGTFPRIIAHGIRNQTGGTGTGTPTFSKKVQDLIKRNEDVKKRFDMKRERNLIGSRDLGRIGLFEGVTTVWNFFPPTFTCPHLVERVGTPGDGGKWMCGLELFGVGQVENGSPTDDCVVYSFGVAEESTFEMEILERTHCKIFAFDPTVDKMNLEGLPPSKMEEAIGRIKFTKIGLGGYASTADPSENIMTLGQIMADHGHDWIDFLKVDIEGAEFESFWQISGEFNESFPFGHLNIEIHMEKAKATNSILGTVSKWLGMGGDDKGILKEFYEFWNMLESRGLRAFVWEDNHGPCINGGKPSLMEYGFINIKDGRNKLLRL